MGVANAPIIDYTGGIFGKLLHARVNLPNYQNACEVMTNFWPLAQGGMTRRPPLEWFASFDDHTKRGHQFPFIFSTEQNYIALLTDDGFTIYDQDGKLSIPSVSCTILNGTFDTSSDWSDLSTGTANMTITGGRLWLDSNGGDYAIGQQAVTINNVGTMHILSFDVYHGPVNVRIGPTAGSSTLLDEKTLATGHHYLAFTPATSTVYLQFYHDENAGRAVDNVTVLSGPGFILPAPYSEADFEAIHYQQIGDVLYLTHNDYWPRRLERRGAYSWSMAYFLPDDGPFNTVNTTNTTIAASATSGEVTLTASDDLFTSDDVGVLFSFVGAGQTVTETAVAGDTYTDGVKVTGITDADRTFTIEITFSEATTATVTLQRSSGNENSYADVSGQTWTASTSVNFDDNLENQTWYYRLAVKPGDYTSGSVTMSIIYQGGSQTGVVRVMTVTSATSAEAEVYEPLSSTDGVRTWKRGAWSPDQGFPVSVTHGYGRLWMARGTRVWSSKSDDFSSFEEGTDDDQAISVTIATPSSEGIRYLGFLSNLVIGTKTAEHIGIPNTASEPVSPSNFQVLSPTARGGASLMPVTADGSLLFIDRQRKRLFQFTQNPKALSETAYIAVDLNELSPDLLWDGIKRVAIQRIPQSRVFVLLENGVIMTLLFRRDIGDIGIAAWSRIPTKGGLIEDACVVNRPDRDVVSCIVRRYINGEWVRSIEQLGSEIVLADEALYHLDAAVRVDLTRPAATAELELYTASSSTGTPMGMLMALTKITSVAAHYVLTTDVDAFAAGDVGKRLWLAGGQYDIETYVNAQEVTVSEVYPATDLDEVDEVRAQAPGRWGFGEMFSTITGLGHLEGETIRVYGDMADLGEFTVTDAAVTLPRECSVAFAGVDVISRWKSLKMAYGAQKGTALVMPKALKSIGFILHRSGAQLEYGAEFDADVMSPVNTRTSDTLWGEPVPLFDGEKFEAYDARFSSDPRLHLQVRGASPCTIAGHVYVLDERDR